MKHIITIDGKKYQVDSDDLTPVPMRLPQAGDVYKGSGGSLIVVIPCNPEKMLFQLGGLGDNIFQLYIDGEDKGFTSQQIHDKYVMQGWDFQKNIDNISLTS